MSIQHLRDSPPHISHGPPFTQGILYSKLVTDGLIYIHLTTPQVPHPSQLTHHLPEYIYSLLIQAP